MFKTSRCRCEESFGDVRKFRHCFIESSMKHKNFEIILRENFKILISILAYRVTVSPNLPQKAFPPFFQWNCNFPLIRNQLINDSYRECLHNERITHHIDSIDRAELERLILCVQYHIDHRAHFYTDDVVGWCEYQRLFQPRLERLLGTLKAWLDHITGHQF